jgi:hypothetical protein
VRCQPMATSAVSRVRQVSRVPTLGSGRQRLFWKFSRPFAQITSTCSATLVFLGLQAERSKGSASGAESRAGRVLGALNSMTPSGLCRGRIRMSAEREWNYLVDRTMAKMLARIASGSVGHSSTTSAKSGAKLTSRAPSAPDSAPP